MSGSAPSRAEEKLLIALRRRKEREAEGLFLAEGVRVAEELLAAGLVPRLVVASASLGDTGRGAELLARLPGDALRTVRDDVLARLSATETPQGILIVAGIPAADPERLPLPDHAFVLALDAVQDPGNFGTLVRSADAFRAAAILALPGTVDAWNPKSVRAAAGSSFRVPILSMATAGAQEWLARRGFAIVVADADGTPVHAFERPARAALVAGNEGAGVSPAWRAAADAVVAVPTPGPVESLNVAVASGILMYVLDRKGRDGTG